MIGEETPERALAKVIDRQARDIERLVAEVERLRGVARAAKVIDRRLRAAALRAKARNEDVGDSGGMGVLVYGVANGQFSPDWAALEELA